MTDTTNGERMTPNDIRNLYSVKEFINHFIESHQREHALEQELTDGKFTEADKALLVSAKELARRLDDLNHEHDRSRQAFFDYLQKSTFESFLKDYTIWRESITKEHGGLMLRTAQVEERVNGMAKAVETLATRDATVSGKFSGGEKTIFYVLVALNLFIAVALHFIK